MGVPIETNRFQARIFWMGTKPLLLDKRYEVKLLTQEVECQVVSIDRVVDAVSLDTASPCDDQSPRTKSPRAELFSKRFTSIQKQFKAKTSFGPAVRSLTKSGPSAIDTAAW